MSEASSEEEPSNHPHGLDDEGPVHEAGGGGLDIPDTVTETAVERQAETPDTGSETSVDTLEKAMDTEAKTGVDSDAGSLDPCKDKTADGNGGAESEGVDEDTVASPPKSNGISSGIPNSEHVSDALADVAEHELLSGPAAVAAQTAADCKTPPAATINESRAAAATGAEPGNGPPTTTNAAAALVRAKVHAAANPAAVAFRNRREKSFDDLRKRRNKYSTFDRRKAANQPDPLY